MKRATLTICLLALALLAVPSRSALAGDTIEVELPEIRTHPGEQITLQLLTGSLTDRGVFSYTLHLVCNSDVILFKRPEKIGTLSADMMVRMSTANPDTVRIAAASASELKGRGTLLKLEAEILSSGESDLRVAKFTMNEGKIPAKIKPGQIVSVVEGESEESDEENAGD